MRIGLSLYPNNEVRVSLTSDPPIRKEHSNRETHETHGFLSPTKAKNPPVDEEDADHFPSPLDISSKVETKPAGFGSLPRKTVFGLAGKRMIQRVGGVFDRKFPREECVFLTGTLPGSTDESFRAMAEWSGYIIHRLKAWVNKYAKGKFDFYCWEWQKRGALHLHYCVYVPCPRGRKCILERFHGEWVRLLRTVGSLAGTDMFANGRGFSWQSKVESVQAYAQAVKKSVAAYLSKYCSKGHKTEYSKYYPSRWWGVSNACRDALKEMSLNLRLDCLSMRKAQEIFEEVISITDRCLATAHTYWHGSGFGRSLVGYHCPQDNPQDIWKTLVNTLNQLSYACLTMDKTEKLSLENRCAISCWVASLPSCGLSLSGTLREKIHSYDFTTSQTKNLSESDWRELYSLACLMCSDSSLNRSSKTVKRIALRNIRRYSSDGLTRK